MVCFAGACAIIAGRSVIGFSSYIGVSNQDMKKYAGNIFKRSFTK
jgi:hypothetical protein